MMSRFPYDVVRVGNTGFSVRCFQLQDQDADGVIVRLLPLVPFASVHYHNALQRVLNNSPHIAHPCFALYHPNDNIETDLDIGRTLFARLQRTRDTSSQTEPHGIQSALGLSGTARSVHLPLNANVEPADERWWRQLESEDTCWRLREAANAEPREAYRIMAEAQFLKAAQQLDMAEPHTVAEYLYHCMMLHYTSPLLKTVVAEVTAYLAHRLERNRSSLTLCYSPLAFPGVISALTARGFSFKSTGPDLLAFDYSKLPARS